jgi:hypothetical protein
MKMTRHLAIRAEFCNAYSTRFWAWPNLLGLLVFLGLLSRLGHMRSRHRRQDNGSLIFKVERLIRDMGVKSRSRAEFSQSIHSVGLDKRVFLLAVVTLNPVSRITRSHTAGTTGVCVGKARLRLCPKPGGLSRVCGPFQAVRG